MKYWNNDKYYVNHVYPIPQWRAEVVMLYIHHLR